jgi:hypothetical protein
MTALRLPLATVVCFPLLALALTACGRPMLSADVGPRQAAVRPDDAAVIDTAAPEEGMVQAREAAGDANAEIEAYDPWEDWNTKAFEFNRRVDKYVLKPVAQGYSSRARSWARGASSRVS